MIRRLYFLDPGDVTPREVGPKDSEGDISSAVFSEYKMVNKCVE